MNLMIDSPNGAAGERLSGDGLPRGGTKAFSIPTFDVSSPGFRPEAFAEAFRTFQIVHLRNTTKGLAKRKHTTWKDIGGIFEGLDPSDRESWCIETQKGEAISAATFLEPRVAATRAYCSFLIQKDKNAYQAAVEKLPLKELGWTEWHYEPALWLFFGRNSLGNGDLEGRAEHTDSVSHDGTWHYQLSGTKEWYLRPSPKLMVHLQSHLSPDLQLPLQETTRIRLECMEGDVIVINTRLWFHSTVIPPQQFPSVSYARDFRETTETRTTEEGSDGMKNVDGLYATKDIEVGSIIFTEKDAPDCELHRSSVNPNCEVVELEDGTSAVVSSRSIAEGEFFCVAESSEEEDGSEDGSNDDSSASDS
jgi:U3 small nucleolar RNA-associated protein 6